MGSPQGYFGSGLRDGGRASGLLVGVDDPRYGFDLPSQRFRHLQWPSGRDNDHRWFGGLRSLAAVV